MFPILLMKKCSGSFWILFFRKLAGIWRKTLYSINQETIKVITDRILTGSEDTDICGKYGVAFF